MAEIKTRGSTSGAPIPALSDKDLDRFWSKVQIGADCWGWMAGRSGKYGGFSFGPRAACRTLLAHRVAYTDLVGPIPPGLTISHLCHNTMCVRPSHLVAEPIKANLGRSIAGEGARDAKLSESDVVEMRMRYKAGGVTFHQLGAQYGVAAITAQQAVRGRTWAHVREGLL